IVNIGAGVSLLQVGTSHDIHLLANDRSRRQPEWIRRRSHERPSIEDDIVAVVQSGSGPTHIADQIDELARGADRTAGHRRGNVRPACKPGIGLWVVFPDLTRFRSAVMTAHDKYFAAGVDNVRKITGGRHGGSGA